MNDLSVFLPIQPMDPAPMRQFARDALSVDADRLWCGQSLAVETQDVFAYLSGLGYAMPFGSGVELMPLRHPFHAAASARSTAILSGRTHVMGLGTGGLSFRRSVGVTPSSPLGYTRDYVTAVRALLDGRPWQFGDEKLPAALPPVVGHVPRVEVGIGVLGARMAEVAGAVADRAITWLAPLPYLDDVIMPTLAAAGGSARTTAIVHCAVDRAGADPVDRVLSVVGQHLRAPHYLRMLRQAGIGGDAADPRGNAQRVLDAGVYLTGEPEQIAAGIGAYWDAGVDEVVVNVGGVYAHSGAAAASEDLRSIFAAVRDLRGWDAPRVAGATAVDVAA